MNLIRHNAPKSSTARFHIALELEAARAEVSDFALFDVSETGKVLAVCAISLIINLNYCKSYALRFARQGQALSIARL